MTATKTRRERLVVVLVRPAKYDDDGYVIRFAKGALPSNTLCVLYGLTERAAREERFADRVDIRIHSYDETVDRVVPEKIARKLRRRADKVLVGLVGVQTNQFPRASDLAKRFAAEGCTVMVGGFHVSGSLALSKEMPEECQDLIDAGVTLVKGEVEECWGDLIEDVLENRVQPVYDITRRPDLSSAPVGTIPPGYLKQFISSHYASIGTSRGCPYGCTFCTVINVQGRKMRVHSTEAILEQIRSNYHDGKGVTWWLFTDDNLARNKYWEDLFDGLIRMREEEGMMDLEFFMQIDTTAHRIPRFAEKAGRAGCSQVFVGVESVNPANLEGAAKKQNKVEDYAAMVEAWHAVGAHVHAAYIIGFPHDTYDSVMADVDRLANDIKVDQVSFFMLTPLPGSEDHMRAQAAGVAMDSDLNRFDSFHAVTDHPRMSREEWFKAYQDAWNRFYTLDNMKRILLRISARHYWGMFKGLLWYRASIEEGMHPMLVGLFRCKDRTERRPGFAVDSRLTHLRKRLADTRRVLGVYFRIFFEMQELWLQTRIPTERLKKRRDWQEQLGIRVNSLIKNLRQAQQYISVSVGNLHEAVEHNIGSLKNLLANISLPAAGQRLHRAGRSGYQSVLQGIGQLWVRGVRTREHLDRFWGQTRDALRQGAVWRVNPFKLCVNFVRDAKLAFSFAVFMLGNKLF